MFDKDILIVKCPNNGRCVICEGFEKAKKENRDLSEDEIEELFVEQEYKNFIENKN